MKGKKENKKSRAEPREALYLASIDLPGVLKIYYTEQREPFKKRGKEVASGTK